MNGGGKLPPQVVAAILEDLAGCQPANPSEMDIKSELFDVGITTCTYKVGVAGPGTNLHPRAMPTDCSARRYFVKFYDPTEEPREIVESEYAMLQRLWLSFGAPNGSALQAVRPIGWVPDLNCVVTEEFPGQDLRSLLRRSSHLLTWRRRSAQNVNLVRKAARWLRKYHLATDQHSSQPFPVDAMLSDFEERLQACVRTGIIDERQAGRLRLALARMQVDLRDKTYPVVIHNPDCGVWNALTDGKAVAFCDFQYCRPGSTYENVSLFYLSLDHISLNPIVSRAAVRRLTAAFLDELGLSASDPVLRWYLLYTAVRNASWLAPADLSPSRRLLYELLTAVRVRQYYRGLLHSLAA